jgi:transcriptional regulator with XRE-family HTH domain
MTNRRELNADEVTAPDQLNAEYYDDIGSRIKTERLALGLTQNDLAKPAGVSRMAVSQLESGAIKSLKAEHLLACADKLNINIRWLITGKGNKSSNITDSSPSELSGQLNYDAVNLGGNLTTLLLSVRLITSIKDWESKNNQSLTDTTFAKICNVSKQTVGDWLKGRTQTMTGEALLNGADYLGVNARWLCSGIGGKQTSFDNSETNLGQDSLYELDGQLNYGAVDFAVLGIIEHSNVFPKMMTDQEWRQKAFKVLYKAWFNEDMRRMGAPPLLNLVV